MDQIVETSAGSVLQSDLPIEAKLERAMVQGSLLTVPSAETAGPATAASDLQTPGPV